jgi:hypothetical protein
MTGEASFAEGRWGSLPGPDDVETLFGGLVQSPVIATLAVLLIALALVLLLVRAVEKQSLSERAQRLHLPSAETRLLSTDSPATVARGLELPAPRPRDDGQRFTPPKGQAEQRVRTYAQDWGPGVQGRLGKPFDLRSLGRKLNVPIERGPPLPRAIDRFAASDRFSAQARFRTDREVRRRAARDGVDRLSPANALAPISEFSHLAAKNQTPKALEVSGNNARGTSRMNAVSREAPREPR